MSLEYGNSLPYVAIVILEDCEKGHTPVILPVRDASIAQFLLGFIFGRRLPLVVRVIKKDGVSVAIVTQLVAVSNGVEIGLVHRVRARLIVVL